MAADQVQIANLALSHIRSLKFIESLDEGSEEAQACRIHYDDTRDLVLSMADWPFARKRQLLAEEGTPPPEWGYQYLLPSDCIRVRAVADNLRVRSFDAMTKYQIENDGTGQKRVILMDLNPATLIYTMRAKNVVLYPPPFVRALSWQLAAEIARPLDRGESVITQCLEIAEQLVGRAAAAAYNENTNDGQPDSDFFTSRVK